MGLDSKITAIRPKGTVILDIFNPLGLTVVLRIFPIGFSNFTIFKISLDKFNILFLSKKSLSIKGLDRLFFFAILISFLF